MLKVNGKDTYIFLKLHGNLFKKWKWNWKKKEKYFIIFFFFYNPKDTLERFSSMNLKIYDNLCCLKVHWLWLESEWRQVNKNKLYSVFVCGANKNNFLVLLGCT